MKRRSSILNRPTNRSRDRTGQSRSTRGTAKRKTPRRNAPSAPWFNLPAILKVEIAGIALMVMAILTLLSFVSTSQGKLASGWLHLLHQGFGWGAFLAPLWLGASGVALLMYSFGRLHNPSLEKITGLVMVFATLLGMTHLLTEATDPWQLVAEGRAGGLLGWVVGEGLRYALGQIGALVTVLAFLVIGLILLMGLSMDEIGMLLWKTWSHVRGWVREWRLPNFSQPASERGYTINERASAKSPELKPAHAPQDKPVEPATAARPLPRAEPAPMTPSFSPTTSVKSGQVKWQLPRIQDLLEDLTEQDISQAEIEKRVEIIERTLESLGVPARVIEVNQGPVITQFGVEPGFIPGRSGKQTKVKVSKISSLADDLALALAAAPIRIEAPVPGRSIVGIEVPNQEIALVSLRGVMETETFEKIKRKTPLPIALGEDVSGEAVVADLISMPHLLIAGATGSGKSVCINAIIATFLCTNTPDMLRMIMVDPKRVELTGYNGIPHLLSPVVVDLERVVGTLTWVTHEMDRRYKQFAKVGARNIEDYNRRLTSGEVDRLPYIVVIIDELADLMMIAPDDVERLVCRIAQMARATGIHLIIATQRPSVDVVTGLIKANFPARVSFMVVSSVDSRVIIDTVGAERLLGQGDMLFMSPSSSQVMRLQGCFVSPAEMERLVKFWKNAAREAGMEQPPPKDQFVQGTLPALRLLQELESELLPGQEDEMIYRAIEVIREEGKASTTLLQRRLRIGYARAARIIEVLAEQGLVGPDLGGSKGREVFVPKG